MKKAMKERVIGSWKSSITGILLIGGAIYLAVSQKDQTGMATLIATAGLGLLGYKENRP